MRLPLLLLAMIPALAGASAQVRPAGPTLDQALAAARSEARAAAAEARRLEGLATKAGNEALRLRARQEAAARAIAATEARISVADVESRLLAARIRMQQSRLAEQQAPARSLLAGLTMMTRRPPLLAIADSTSVEEAVRVRLLLDATLPAIRRRTASLSDELARGQKLEQSLAATRATMAAERAALSRQQQQFAAMEADALRLAQRRGEEALAAGDVALSRGELLAGLSSQAAQAAAGRRLAGELASLGRAPARPFPAGGRPPVPALRYRLPNDSPVTIGFGEVSAAGIRSRGLVLASTRGAKVIVPASGIIRFAGPYRRHDAVVIIEHRGGWRTLLLNVRTDRRPGSRVEAGDELGHALGPISVELSQNGRHVSPALIAGSSAKLSNGAKAG